MTMTLANQCRSGNTQAETIRWMVLVLGNKDRRRYGFNEWAKTIRDDLLGSGEWIERQTGPEQIEILHRCMAMN